MPRPPKSRTVRGEPQATYFKPRGIPARLLETVVLGLDELEAIRLADLEGLYQEEAAARMNISRPTFGRLVAQARHKVADALFNGKALVFEGGAISLGEMSRFECRKCGEQWDTPVEDENPENCSACGSTQVDGMEGEGRGSGRGRGSGQGKGRGRGRGRGSGQGKGRGKGRGGSEQ
ncbi:MAG: DUF134 domain-containing protein [Gemmatimonadetes bacterium]|jgi:uncharacterized protein|nr:DUF134 domain-containing protein [Gemmatimonadota bacterium]